MSDQVRIEVWFVIQCRLKNDEPWKDWATSKDEVQIDEYWRKLRHELRPISYRKVTRKITEIESE